RYWLDTGWVAKKKLVNLLMPEVCSIPRGKAGKDVEFGLKWGLTRFGGGFLLGHAGAERGNFNDKKHVEESVTETKELFGDAPQTYAYDRGGYSQKNIQTLSQLGVRRVGIAPPGSAKWEVDDKTRRRVRRERVKVEGSIGALKSSRYGFNRPNVRSTEMMLASGHRSILGYNLNRLLQRVAEREEIQLAGA
ncbi:MAG: hypothetical protein AAFY60_22460, partial [Myxococcota bacterium]